ncbi:glycosyltransferase family 2 protein [Hydrogenimonas sp.]
MVEQISVTILTKNSERYLARCLEALKPFDEVLILDNGSTDDTLKIAEGFDNVTIIKHPFIGFGQMKNLAAQKARNGWILSIDSDEVATEGMVEAIGQLDPSLRMRIYAFDRLNHYRGKPVRCCGWYPDRVLRLYHRDHTRFSNAMVHESLQLPPGSERIDLKAKLLHYPFDSVEELIEKMQRYSTLYAKQSQKPSSPAKAFGRAAFAFFRNYVLQRGFLCGYEGLLISVSNANGVFYKYMKRYEKQRQERS